ncbi:hypothetical protein EBR96_03655 [bacterium]|nr:hypothetical protein [bacterium]
MAAKSIDTKWLIIGGALIAFGPNIMAMIREGRINQTERLETQRQQRNRNRVRMEYRDSRGRVVRTRLKEINLESISREIYDAFYRNDWAGITEDETKAIRALRNVPKPLIPRLTAIYRQTYNKDLAEDFRRFLSDSDYRPIANLFT